MSSTRMMTMFGLAWALQVRVSRVRRNRVDTEKAYATGRGVVKEEKDDFDFLVTFWAGGA